jgi:hypothetical protein
MSDGQRIDWRAIPSRYRRWRALPAWRKLLWLVVRGVTTVVAYVGSAVAILWFNEPVVVEAVGAGRAPVWALVTRVVAQPELLLLLALLVPAILAAVLLPHRPDWG